MPARATVNQSSGTPRIGGGLPMIRHATSTVDRQESARRRRARCRIRLSSAVISSEPACSRRACRWLHPHKPGGRCSLRCAPTRPDRPRSPPSGLVPEPRPGGRHTARRRDARRVASGLRPNHLCSPREPCCFSSSGWSHLADGRSAGMAVDLQERPHWRHPTGAVCDAATLRGDVVGPVACRCPAPRSVRSADRGRRSGRCRHIVGPDAVDTGVGHAGCSELPMVRPDGTT